MTIFLKRKVRVVITLVAAVLLIILGIIGMVSILNNFKSALVSYQDRLILGTTTTLSRNVNSYINKYSSSLSSLTQQNRTIEAEKAYLAKGYTERILRVLQFNMARQGGNLTAMAVFSPEGSLITSTDEKNYEFLKENLRLRSEEVNVYFSKGADGEHCLAFCSRSAKGLFYMALIPIKFAFNTAVEDKNLEDNTYLILFDSTKENMYFYDGTGIYIAETAEISRNFSSTSTSLDELADLISNKPGGYTDEISFEYNNSLWSCLIGGVEVKVDFGSLFIVTAMKLDEVVAPVQKGAVQLSVSIILLLVGVLLLVRNILLAGRRNEQALYEISALREKSNMLEEINRQEQEQAHKLRLQEIGTMTSGIAHEFNNLLTPIMGYSLLLLEMLSPEESDYYDSALEIYNASEKAKEIINQISYLSRKNMDTTFVKVAVDELVQKVMEFAMFAKQSNIALEKNLNCQGIFVYGNETLLAQVLINIYINACQAMSEKGGRLSVQTYTQDYEGIKKAFIEIGNTGNIIDETILHRIFEPFFTTKETGKGTGLGLAIAKQILEGHNGSVSASNNGNGGGVTFTIILPIAD